MRAFITGSTGFVGINLVDFLNKHNVEVIEHQRALCFQQECSYKEFDFIFHCASALYNEYDMIESNISLTYDLLEATKGMNYKCFINMGSWSEYQDLGYEYISENCPTFSHNLYTLSKTTSAELCRIYSKKYDKRIVTVRPFSPYGPHEKSFKFFPTIYDKTLAGEKITIGKGMHDWTYIDDFVSAMWVIANNNTVKGYDVVNIGTGIETSNKEAYNMFSSILGLKTEAEFLDKSINPYDREHVRCDTWHARSRYGFEAKTDLFHGLRKYDQWRR